MELAIGTAQFGLPYGVTNTQGQVSEIDARDILLEASRNGITKIDTAAGYGISESVLGKLIGKDASLEIVTKAIALPGSVSTSDAIELVVAQFERSLQRLRRQKVYGLLFHNAKDLVGPIGDLLFGKFLDFKSRGRISKLGVSVYESAEAEILTERYPIDIIQLPINVLDQRMIERGILGLLRKRRVEVHVRSVFLQGALLVAPENLKNIPAGLVGPVRRFQADMSAHKMSALDGALAFVKSLPVDVAIVGTTSAVELKSIVSSWKLVQSESIEWRKFRVVDPSLVDPRKW